MTTKNQDEEYLLAVELSASKIPWALQVSDGTCVRSTYGALVALVRKHRDEAFSLMRERDSLRSQLRRAQMTDDEVRRRAAHLANLDTIVMGDSLPGES